MLFPTPLWVRLLGAALGLLGLFIGGYRLIRMVGRESGQLGKYVADAQTGCAYPERYVRLKNAKESGFFIPVDRQRTFKNRAEALSAGFHQCQE